MNRIIAVDGGGTGTKACLCAAGTGRNGAIIPDSILAAGPSNPNDIGEESSAGLIAELCHKLAAGASPDDRLVIFAGISGAVGHEETLEKLIRAELEDSFAGVTISVKADVYNLFGFLPEDEDCAVLIAGTGSACFYRINGGIYRTGGWGYLLDGICGGGYAIGRAGIEAALRAADKRGPSTSLLDAAEKYTGSKLIAPGTVASIYKGGKPFIAGFAPAVSYAAAAGDTVAVEIIRKAAEGLAELLFPASAASGSRIDVVCSGGLFNDGILKEALTAEINRKNIKAGLSFPAAPQLEGAAVQALRLAERVKK